MIPVVNLIDDLYFIDYLLGKDMFGVQVIVDGKDIIRNGNISALHQFAISIYQCLGRFDDSLSLIDKLFGLIQLLMQLFQLLPVLLP